MARACWQQHDVARLNLDLFPIFAAQYERRISSRKAQHLMRG